MTFFFILHIISSSKNFHENDVIYIIFFHFFAPWEVLKISGGNSMIYFSGCLYTQHRVTEEKLIFLCEDRAFRSKYELLNLIVRFFVMLLFLSSSHECRYE